MQVTQILVLTIVGLGLAAAGLFFAVRGLQAATADDVTARLREYSSETAAPLPLSSASMISLRQAELSGTFQTRVMTPWLNGLARSLGRMTPMGVMEDLRHQLAMAGNPLGLGPREFYGIRLAMTFGGMALAAVLLISAFSDSDFSDPALSGGGLTAASSSSAMAEDPFASDLPIPFERVVLAAVILLFASRAPRMWLRSQVRSRQNRIRRALPDALDMLSICADAGLGFDQALQRVSESWKSPLAIEFGRVVAEMQMGVSRQAALRNLANRTDVSELSSFVAVIIQSDQLGMSIANTLHGQAEQMRVERRYRAQEEARKMPLKMLFPMLLLMMPAMFAIVLGPAALTLGQVFDSILAGSGAAP